jgi:hypothetical protein
VSHILDRREQHKDKSPTSCDRFIRRHKEIIKQAAAEMIRRRARCERGRWGNCGAHQDHQDGPIEVIVRRCSEHGRAPPGEPPV